MYLTIVVWQLSWKKFCRHFFKEEIPTKTFSCISRLKMKSKFACFYIIYVDSHRLLWNKTSIVFLNMVSKISKTRSTSITCHVSNFLYEKFLLQIFLWGYLFDKLDFLSPPYGWHSLCIIFMNMWLVIKQEQGQIVSRQ